jgi:MGT family glycosyltransferase
MKSVFFNIPGHGHVNPSLSLVKELVARGEEVDYYCTEDFRMKIEKSGATFFPLPEHLIRNENQIDFNLLGVFGDMLECTKLLLPFLLEKIQKEDYQYIVTDVFAVWGRILAEKINIPIVILFPCFAMHPKLKEPRRSELQLLSTPFRSGKQFLRVNKHFRELKKKYNYKNITNVVDLLRAPQDDLTLVFTAQQLQPQRELFKANYVFTGPNLDYTLRVRDENFPFGLLKGKKVVYISLGSVLYNRTFYQKCIQAFSGTDYLVVLNISKKLSVASFDVPANFIVCNHVPQLELLPKCTVFITHGGMNSVHEGLYFEVPMVVVPQVSDQFLVAQTISNKGLGIWLRNTSATAILKATEDVQQNQIIKRNVKEMSQSLKNAGGASKAASTILEKIKGSRTL